MTPTRSRKTDVVPITPHRLNLSDQSLEPLLQTDLHLIAGGGEVAWEWSKLPVSDQRYQIQDRIASGGMGHLYTAADKVLGRKVAIKVLRRSLLNDPDAVVRFLQESRIHAQLTHPGIPPLHDVGRLTDGRPFLAMKYIRGRPLADVPMSSDWERCRAIFDQVCRVVGYAHSKKVIHRDLNPNNVLISDRGRVYVIDWGLAKVFTPPAPELTDDTGVCPGTTQMCVPNLTRTDAGLALGTPAYMAPELTDGGSATAQSDVFGLGSILCFMLTDRPPFDGRKSSILRQVKSKDTTSALKRLKTSSAPDELVALAKSCLATTLAIRPKTVQEVIQTLAAVPDAGESPDRPWWVNLFRRRVS